MKEINSHEATEVTGGGPGAVFTAVVALTVAVTIAYVKGKKDGYDANINHC